MNKLSIVIGAVIIALGCTEVKNVADLPVLGRERIVKRMEGDREIWDTIPHSIANFAFLNQDSVWITNESLIGKIYVADFFFTSCPTICPTMKQQMLRVYDAYKENDQVAIVSHTIDPEYDTVGLLSAYAEQLGVSSQTWHFLTGDKNELYELGETSYMVVADEDPDAPGGFIHSGAFLLVDKERRIRGVYDGTEPVQVDILIKDIRKLLKSYEK